MKDKKTTICFVQTNSYTLFNNKDKSLIHGGSELQSYFLAKELANDSNFGTSFIVGDFGQKDLETRENVKIFKAATPMKGEPIFVRIKQSFLFWRAFKKVEADIYFTSSANMLVGLVGLFCKIYRKKHIHRTASAVDVDGTFIKSNGFFGRIYKFGLENASIVVTQNFENRNDLKVNHKLKARVLKNSFTLDKENNQEKKSILWVSRCDTIKRPHKLLKLAEKFPKEDFIMICPLREDCRDLFEETKKRAKESQNVHFLESVAFTKIQNYYNEAKIFVNTSDYEGFPNTFVQACISSTPIVSLKVNPDNFLNEHNCGYCAEGNFDQMCDDLKNVLNKKSDWEQKSRNARKYVEGNHDINKNIKKLKLIIEELMQ